jgi:predicted RND superfamily exporter protein
LTAALIICALAFGSLRLSVSAISSLIVGVVLMMGTLGWIGARLNFLNFVVLPITFGISADYAINILRRYQADWALSNAEGVASTAGAVALCSATTIIAFGSLLTANNQALYSFGVFAVAGEVTMLATAALSLPAFLALRGRARPTTQMGCAVQHEPASEPPTGPKARLPHAEGVGASSRGGGETRSITADPSCIEQSMSGGAR